VALLMRLAGANFALEKHGCFPLPCAVLLFDAVVMA
jgi:hypothetical protein